MNAAQRLLNPDNPDSVRIVVDADDSRELQVGIIGYLIDPNRKEVDPLELIAVDIAGVAREGNVLVFANSRRVVELVTSALKEIGNQSPEHFPLVLAHHGSLSKEVRESAEKAAKEGRRVILVATSSLELGIDIGSMHRICHIDPPYSIVALRQRMGRCGRKEGQPIILRIYTRDLLPIREVNITAALYPNLTQAVAMVELLLRARLEPAEPDKFHLSTLAHQALSNIRQWGAIPAEKLYEFLCVHGPFRKVGQDLFADVLHSLKAHDLIGQNSESKIVLGKEGKKLTGRHEFYAAFATNDEYTVRCNETTIGYLPAAELPKLGSYIKLAGRKWRVDSIDRRSKTIEVTAADVGNVPVFLGNAGDIHTLIFKQMQQSLGSIAPVKYLDPTAIGLFESARATARRAGLHEREVLVNDRSVKWFPWIGTRGQKTLQLFAAYDKLEVGGSGLCLNYDDIGVERFRAHVEKIVSGKINPVELAALMREKKFQKFDLYLTPAILDIANATDRLDIQGAVQAASCALKELRNGGHSITCPPTK